MNCCRLSVRWVTLLPSPPCWWAGSKTTMVSGEGTPRGSTVTCLLRVFPCLLHAQCALPGKHFWTWLQILGCPSSFADLLFCLFGCSRSSHMIASSSFIFSSYLQLKSVLSAALPDLGGTATGCRNLPSDSGLMAFPNALLQDGTKRLQTTALWSHYYFFSAVCWTSCKFVFFSAEMLRYSSSSCSCSATNLCFLRPVSTWWLIIISL